LLATQNIRGGANQIVLRRIKHSGDIFFARADDPWVLAGATVHISFVGQDDGSEIERQLDGAAVAEINADLTSGLDLTEARRLDANQGTAFQGVTLGGPFDISEAGASRMIAAPNPDGRSNSDVVRPVINAQDITGRARGVWAIDFGPDMPESEAALYEAPFEYARRHVRPFRLSSRRKAYAERWWLPMEARPGLRRALRGMSRYIATPITAKHRIFIWVPATTLPLVPVVAVARDDDYTFGLLHSRVHELWARATGTQLREVESGFRYTPTTCFDTFPFPDPTPGQRMSVGEAARRLVQLRDGWLNPDSASVQELESRTLTNLYNQWPGWLEYAHAELDHAALDAYGWPKDIADDDLLSRLLSLNRSSDGDTSRSATVND
jgi:hypothetical protein